MNIKTVICGVLALSIIGSAFAQDSTPRKYDIVVFGSNKPKVDPHKPRSTAYTVTSTGVSFTYLKDGYSSSALAVNYPVFSVVDTPVTIDAIGSYQNGTQLYLGGGLDWHVYKNKNGWSLNLMGGYKGFDVSHGFDFSSGKGGLVYGFGISVPLLNSGN